MMHCPAQEGYSVQFNINPGQNMYFKNQVSFKLEAIGKYELKKTVIKENGASYHPFLITITYADNGRQYQLMNTGVFKRGPDGKAPQVDGARIVK